MPGRYVKNGSLKLTGIDSITFLSKIIITKMKHWTCDSQVSYQRYQTSASFKLARMDSLLLLPEM